MLYKHQCIKCKIQYDTDDPDPYYCEGCHKSVKQIAEEVDKKLAMKPKKEVKSDLKIFDELAQTRGVKGFVNYKDLGISL